MSERNWVVWSFEHDAWWAANGCGYVQALLLAGLYTEAEAKEIERGANHPLRINEEGRPLAAVLREYRQQWGRSGPMVINLLENQPEHVPQVETRSVPELSPTESAPTGAQVTVDDA